MRRFCSDADLGAVSTWSRPRWLCGRTDRFVFASGKVAVPVRWKELAHLWHAPCLSGATHGVEQTSKPMLVSCVVVGFRTVRRLLQPSGVEADPTSGDHLGGRDHDSCAQAFESRRGRHGLGVGLDPLPDVSLTASSSNGTERRWGAEGVSCGYDVRPWQPELWCLSRRRATAESAPGRRNAARDGRGNAFMWTMPRSTAHELSARSARRYVRQLGRETRQPPAQSLRRLPRPSPAGSSPGAAEVTSP